MSITAPQGFVAAGGSMGIKADGVFDVALVASATGRPVVATAVFTTNLAAAAPVQLSRAHLEVTGGTAAAVLLTSGNANAATGTAGAHAARVLCEHTADALGVDRSEILLCQTGLIGFPFPLETTISNLAPVIDARSIDGGADAARAIMTTDTFAKEVVINGSTFTVGAMAKGAAMLAPNMATMLCVITTDAAADAPTLHSLLKGAVGDSFNKLVTDGATSTNDTVIALASGLAGPPDIAELGAALRTACAELAQMMATDAEGATKLCHLSVVGARSDHEAQIGARKIANSILVKCSFNGSDPYWGRIVSELGSAGIGFDLSTVAVRYGGIEVCTGGTGSVGVDEAALHEHMAGRTITIEADLGLGDGRAALTTVDLSHAYIDENRTTS